MLFKTKRALFSRSALSKCTLNRQVKLHQKTGKAILKQQPYIRVEGPESNNHHGVSPACLKAWVMCPLITPLQSSSLHMIQSCWASSPTTTRQRTLTRCESNCLFLNISKTEKLLFDFRSGQQRNCNPLKIRGTPVERVSSLQYLGVHIFEDLTWTQSWTCDPENFICWCH